MDRAQGPGPMGRIWQAHQAVEGVDDAIETRLRVGQGSGVLEFGAGTPAGLGLLQDSLGHLHHRRGEVRGRDVKVAALQEPERDAAAAAADFQEPGRPVEVLGDEFFFRLPEADFQRGPPVLDGSGEFLPVGSGVAGHRFGQPSESCQHGNLRNTWRDVSPVSGARLSRIARLR